MGMRSLNYIAIRPGVKVPDSVLRSLGEVEISSLLGKLFVCQSPRS